MAKVNTDHTNTKEINLALKVVKLTHERFKVPGGYIKPTGYAFKHPEHGYLRFKNNISPYIPLGGKKTCEEILGAGGFLHFDDIVWIKPMD
ncbi:hypothetical protein ASD24_24630 [Paenibacillus sp. Root52]|uniref:hypothetical protein n=1 Tax=Paenibacillus sp. Root52 TaxID=1736552 RepID=UPI0006FC9840|nr:hypothetical protein [Paenibacillus sp. Root52]KQY90985.1 hypothetical protein ASD24_24630 [Paenibacillus sp. Root52]